ncbi:hypothetical protein CVT24_008497 [Panaeolus cyanescens]|uniref:Chromatin elongation factor SPT5 n=1 Tax=Panaeolus cyanescens TaxID=181874 RepID=A0A409WCW6_9AGAR|nr:hypothetical protein CVT24_008497 [Panaeolus cyanescens]
MPLPMQRKRTWEAMNEDLADAEGLSGWVYHESSVHSMESDSEDPTIRVGLEGMRSGEGPEPNEQRTGQGREGIEKPVYEDEGEVSVDGARGTAGRKANQKDRRRAKRRNPFIDNEAEASDEDEETEPDVGGRGFIDDNDNDNDEADEESVSRDYQHHCRLLQSSDVAASQQYWDELLSRAYGRTKYLSDQRIGIEDHDEDEDEYVISPKDLLWEVPCKAGLETDIVFSIFNRATQLNIAAPSAMFNPSHPGRVYIEAAAESAARSTVDGIPGVFIRHLKPVPSSLRRQAMTPSPRSIPIWVRIRDTRQKWRHVNGTVGMISPLLDERGFEVIWEVIVAHKEAGSSEWMWTSTRLDNIRFTMNFGQLPTVADLQRFSGCPAVQEYSLSLLYERIYRSNLRPGARVRVTRGDFIGAAGYVVEVSGSTVDIQIEDGSLETVPTKCVRRHFIVGDEVTIVTNPWKGEVGWVVSVEGDFITIWSDARSQEYRIAAIEAEFFCSSFRRIPQLPSQGSSWIPSLPDPYSQYKGRMVLVSGQHPLKGHRGLVRDTHPDGRIWIQMESILNGNRTLQFKHRNISLIDTDTNTLRPLSETTLAKSQPLEIPFATPVLQDQEPKLGVESSGSSTPFPDNVPVIDESNSEDFPQTEDIELMPIDDPYWLVDACFKERIKLAHLHDQHHIVQLVGRGSRPGMVMIRDRKGAILEMKSSTLTALRPEAPNDMVVVLKGEHAGTVYKVVEVRQLELTVKKVGRVKKKKDVDPVFSNDNLIQVFGAYK